MFETSSMKLLLIIVSLLAVALVCLLMSEQIMTGYHDCSMLHTVGSRTEGCASDMRLLFQPILRYAAGALGILVVVLPAFIDRRNDKRVSGNEEPLSIVQDSSEH